MILTVVSRVRSHIVNKAAWLLLASLWLAPGLVHAQAANSVANSIDEHEQRAHADLAQKHPELAIPEFEAVLAVDPNNLDAQGNLGVLLFFQNKFAAAVPYLRAAVAQKPDLSKIQALLGLAEKALGQEAQARTDLEAAVPQLAEPGIRVQAGLALIELYAEARQLDKAAAIVALLRQVAPEDPRVLYTAYRIASDQAGEALLSLSVAAPGSPQMHQAIAHELVRARDEPGTIANLRQAAALDPALPGVHYELAEALAEADDPKLRSEAEPQYRLALAQNPRDARSLAALGDIAVVRGDLPGATGLYQQALAIEPHLEEANLGLATVHAEQGDSAGAAALLEQAIAADPTDALAHYRLATAYRKLGRPADAEKELAEYKRYKELKEKLRLIYKDLRQPTPAQPAKANAP